MNIKYDADADAVYIGFQNRDVKAVSTQGEWPFHIDIDGTGNVIGIEIMDAAETLSKEFLLSLKNRLR